MAPVQVPAAGGALRATVLHREYLDELRQIALDFLLSGAEVKPAPTKHEAAELMAIFAGIEVSATDLHWGYEELAFEDMPRDVSWTTPPPQEVLDDFSVTIIGAGFSGIALAIYLDRLGINYRIIEKNAGVGGTWYINDYPQARVDIPSHMYQFRFIKNYPWASYFATGEELKEYLAQIVDDFDLAAKIELNTELTQARWNDDTSQWELGIVGPNGDEQITSNVVFSCVGLFNRPNLPDIAGIDDFEGTMFHTTAWDYTVDYTGKRVAVIGTGSTGSQLIPEVAEKAGHLTVFQRTANWVNPLAGYKATISEHEHWLFDNVPGYWNWYVYALSLADREIQALQVMDDEWIAAGGRVNERNDLYTARLKDFIRSKVGGDDELFDKLVPSYAPLARRLVIDNGFYDALLQDNVDLITDPIDHISARGVVTNDATGEVVEQEFDLIVLSAGFRVGEYLWPVDYQGRDGVTLQELWAKDGARAYLGLTMAKFPNFFVYYGPNGQARGGSFHGWVEAFTRYCLGLVVEMVESGASSLEVRPDVFDDYNAALDEAHSTILWEHEGTGSYYVNQHGRSGVNMPWTQQEYYEMVRVPDPENYDFR